MGEAGVNNKILKQRNRGLLLKLVATGECSSRISLSQKTGLAKMTVTNIVNEFLENGMMEECEKVQTEGKGRNPIQLCISSKAPKVIGLHLYRGRCDVILCDIQLKSLLKKISFPVSEANADDLMKNIFAAIDEVISAAAGEKIWGIGISTLGPSDILEGKILEPVNFHGIHDLELKKEIEEHYHMPVYFDSETNGAAIIEKYYGNGKDCDDFMYMLLANGVGSSIVVGGKLYTSSGGMSCEFGHISIDWQGRRCKCGNRGCLETYISSNVLTARMQELTGENKHFHEFCQDMENAVIARKETGREFDEREKRIDAVLLEMSEYLASGIVSFSNGLNPQKIIIGLDSYWVPDQYLELTEKQVNERLLNRKYRDIKIEKSYFGAEGTVYGSTGPLLTAIFAGELFA